MKTVPRKSTSSTQVYRFVHRDSSSRLTCSTPCCYWSGDIKLFFGVKTEQQDSLASSPNASSEPAKPEKAISSATTPSSPVQKDEHDVKLVTSPKKQFKQFSPKFLPASSLLGKRSDEENHDLTSSKVPTTRRRVSVESPRPKWKSPGPKQSSLDFFFSKSPK